MITILIVVIGIALAIGISLLLLSIVLNSQDKAKNEAKSILELGKIENYKKFKRISKILATAKDNPEAVDLWKQLQELKSKT